MRRFLLVLCLLAAFGLGELALLYRVGEAIGFDFTLLLLVGTALVGFYAGKAQGLGVLRRWLDAEGDGTIADEGLTDGLLVLLGGVLLVMPGLIGDALGLLLLTPPIRRRLAERLRMRAAGWVQAGSAQVITIREVHHQREEPEPEPLRIIDAEAIDVEGVVVEDRPERLLGP